MTYTPDTRSLTTYYPFRGTLHRQLHLQLRRNLTSYDWAFDGDAAASATILLGSGDGSDREEAASIDPSSFYYGTILETVNTAGPEVDVLQLQDIVNEQEAVNKHPITLSVTTAPNDPTNPARRFIGVLNVGDLLPTTIEDGPVYDDDGKLLGYNLYVNDIYRITQIGLNPDGTLGLTMNLRSFGNAP